MKQVWPLSSELTKRRLKQAFVPDNITAKRRIIWKFQSCETKVFAESSFISYVKKSFRFYFLNYSSFNTTK